MLFQCMLRGLDTVAPVAEDYPFNDRTVFDWPRLAFVEHRYAGDPTNWFVPNRAAVEAMLRSAGFSILDRPKPEVYLCALGPENGFAEATAHLADRP